jgi:hypothetical protein
MDASSDGSEFLPSMAEMPSTSHYLRAQAMHWWIHHHRRPYPKAWWVPKISV